MTCGEVHPLIDAYFDGELELGASLEVEQHMAACEACREEYRKRELLREEIAGAGLEEIPAGTLERVRASVERKGGLRAAWWQNLWHSPAWLVAVAAVVALALYLPGRPGAGAVDREIVDSHLRSLLGEHLIDVPSSDRHTVKPWFQGKLEFAPPVPDLTERGFVLVGGRLDVIGGRKAAAIVYKRREHVINLWVWQQDGGASEPALREVNRYHVTGWSKDGLAYRAVSDVDPGELRVFAEAVRAQ